jgi:hypothetical protein
MYHMNTTKCFSHSTFFDCLQDQGYGEGGASEETGSQFQFAQRNAAAMA